MPEDIFDIVNERDEVVGRERRSYVHSNKLLHRSAQVLIFCDTNEGRKILLQKRSKLKDKHPLLYTASCSGHVDSGESYDEGAVREMREETGIECSADQLSKIGKIEASEGTGWEFAFVYVFFCDFDTKFSFSPDEVDSLKWVSISEFERILRQEPQTCTPVFASVYDFYLSKTKK